MVAIGGSFGGKNNVVIQSRNCIQSPTLSVDNALDLHELRQMHSAIDGIVLLYVVNNYCNRSFEVYNLSTYYLVC